METGEEPEEIPLKLTTFPKINGVLGVGGFPLFKVAQDCQLWSHDGNIKRLLKKKQQKCMIDWLTISFRNLWFHNWTLGLNMVKDRVSGLALKEYLQHVAVVFNCWWLAKFLHQYSSTLRKKERLDPPPPRQELSLSAFASKRDFVFGRVFRGMKHSLQPTSGMHCNHKPKPFNY